MVCFWYVIVNILHKGDNKDDYNDGDDDSNNNNTNTGMQNVKILVIDSNFRRLRKIAKSYY